ncbi:MAG: ABC transporter ATP-binding protein [Acidobacteria bacterium]|nr:ABC transporter ATP-binding protein [Acidobacteriota bacterium]
MAADQQNSGATGALLVRVAGLCKSYEQKRWLSHEKFRVAALDGVDLSIARGTTLALVGESGSGKSTLARCLVRLEAPTAGEIWYDGRDLLGLSQIELRAARREIQLIFQDPAAALNPRLTAEEIVAEPLLIAGALPKQERRERVLDLMEQVGLPGDAADRRPAEFSGGQRQRMAIARALTLEPKLLILDEALSALDLSIQAQMVNLLLDLQATRGLTYLFITHDLSLAGHVADCVAVIHRGQIVESGAPAQIFHRPHHPHTRALVAAMPFAPPLDPAGGQAVP